jgi:replicative DNA helicase
MPSILNTSEPLQQAVLGHAIYNNDIFETLTRIGVTKDWFASQTLADFYGHIQAFKKVYKRYPSTWQELTESIKDTDPVRNSFVKLSQKCEDAVLQYQWDFLETQLIDWAKGALIYTKAKLVGEDYNAEDIAKAAEILDKTVVEIQKIDAFGGGANDCFHSVADGVKLEEAERLAEADRILPFNIKFLQDSTRGMLPSDVILLCADTGVGKTEAAKGIACHVAKVKQQPVFYFALEAENLEIERRIKYGLMSRWYREDHEKIPQGVINYGDWRHNRLQEELDKPYRKRAEDVFVTDYKNLHVYYPKVNTFGWAALEKQILAMKNDASMFVLDHLHYMDLGENENREMGNLVKNIKTMGQALKIPFLLVCHVKKKDKRTDHSLMPDLTDIHGSGNISKISTQAIIMGPAYGFMSTDPRAVGVPTFIKMPKIRIDRTITYYTAVTFFNYKTLEYSPYYALGHFNRRGDKWEPKFSDFPAWVDKEALIRDCGPVE